MTDKPQRLRIANREFNSRLIMGTGKFASGEIMAAALEASGAEIVTVALRRADLSGRHDRFANILTFIDNQKYTLLPNTSGARTAGEACRLARLGRRRPPCGPPGQPLCPGRVLPGVLGPGLGLARPGLRGADRSVPLVPRRSPVLLRGPLDLRNPPLDGHRLPLGGSLGRHRLGQLRIGLLRRRARLGRIGLGVIGPGVL